MAFSDVERDPAHHLSGNLQQEEPLLMLCGPFLLCESGFNLSTGDSLRAAGDTLEKPGSLEIYTARKWKGLVAWAMFTSAVTRNC